MPKPKLQSKPGATKAVKAHKPARAHEYKTLLQSEERFRTLIEQSTDAIQLLDETGKIVYSSDSIKTVLGYEPEELLGEVPPDFIHPDDTANFLQKVGELMGSPGGQIHLEYRVKHKNGKWVWLETIGVNHLHNPAIKALVGNFRDITKRKEVEQALAESEARLRFMAEAMPQKIFTVNSDGKMDYFNPQWTEYTGLSYDDIHRETFLKFIHPDDIKNNIKAWNKAVESGEPFVYEHRFRGADGSYRWHLTRARAMHGIDGKVIMWIGSSTDIEDVKQARIREERLEHQAALLTEQHRQLLELNKAKDEFISLASHQLRTPATGVKQYLGMIREGYAGDDVPEAVLRMVDVAYESNERQLKIVNDLLKVAYVDAGKLKLEKENCDMRLLVDDVVAELASVIQVREQAVVVSGNCKNSVVDADARLMRMVLENLIDNASKYSLKGTRITVALSCTKKFLKLAITDQGVGIAPEDIDKLFKKFSRIDNPLSTLVGGTGLGLYRAKQVVELHGGTLGVQSEADKGSAFTIKIPLA